MYLVYTNKQGGTKVSLQLFIWKIIQQLSSGQHGGIDRNPLLPHTTKRRITINLKSINNQKCHKIKLYGTPTTTELKKQSNKTARLVRMQMERNHSKVVDCVGRPG